AIPSGSRSWERPSSVVAPPGDPTLAGGQPAGRQPDEHRRGQRRVDEIEGHADGRIDTETTELPALRSLPRPGELPGRPDHAEDLTAEPDGADGQRGAVGPQDGDRQHD